MFRASEEEEAREIIEEALPQIQEIAETVRYGRRLLIGKISFSDVVKSSLVNLFYPMFISAKKFRTTDLCMGCGIRIHVRILLLNHLFFNQSSSPRRSGARSMIYLMSVNSVII